MERKYNLFRDWDAIVKRHLSMTDEEAFKFFEELERQYDDVKFVRDSTGLQLVYPIYDEHGNFLTYSWHYATYHGKMALLYWSGKLYKRQQ